jgi:hypothetical protein
VWYHFASNVINFVTTFGFDIVNLSFIRRSILQHESQVCSWNNWGYKFVKNLGVNFFIAWVCRSMAQWRLWCEHQVCNWFAFCFCNEVCIFLGKMCSWKTHCLLWGWNSWRWN